ncbi:MAG: TatD family hydrolase [Magnetococcales bacterium]|nr:TatD family hydrolase [Magnetococcales bacterium]
MFLREQIVIDTHCHLDHAAFSHDRQRVLERCREVGVEQLVMPGVTLGGFPDLVALADSTRHVALGLHPCFLLSHPANALIALEQWIKGSPCIAVGEIGLDFRADRSQHERQRSLLAAQLDLAEKYRLPVILHVIKAHDQTLALLRQKQPPSGGIVHSFNGSLQQANQYIELGFVLGFGGVVTRDRSHKIKTVAAALPDSALVLESDAPDLPPAGHEDERNEPSYLPIVVQTLTRLRQVSESELIRTTVENSKKILNIA